MVLTLDRITAREGFPALIAALGGPACTRLVGGVVRDTLIGLDPADVDLATRLLPDAVLAALKAAGIRAVPTGLAHGTVTAVLPSGPIEVTTLRRDVATDGRHATVAFTDAWAEDAARRDFTMNALYADPENGAIFDYFGGLDDLAARRVRFIGDPYRRIAEDHLRILRFFRFHARFGDAIDADGLDACAARANDLMALSRERIAAELLKLLVAPDAVAVVTLMIARGILRAVLPEIADASPLAALADREAEAGVAPDAIRRLAALLPADAAEPVGARLKLSNEQRRRLAAAHDGPGDEGPRALAYRCGPAIARDRLLLAGRDVTPLADWTPPALPIGGGALVQRGLRKGPAVARVLRGIETAWIAEGFPGAGRVDQLADAAVAAALADTIIDSASTASSGRA
ncbi:CCA tRNA nucleotidyltransferase [Sphingomonas sp. A2-49]|uniref:CCA tRNA nucleotidyltransferase n=1 Tax=Sphingomonas sp. A2-49 TaxID=1391375 RepID=UPI0021D069F2|nr:CCA tRNA nucleotidyltransferase [Sphingomonas sp. A2-49]MCU6455511.1 CCA tRNA nucleotidyltransferase [Sphingomonas sp. A2-49]